MAWCRWLAAAAALSLLAGCPFEDRCGPVSCSPCLPNEAGVWLMVSDSATGAAAPNASAPGFACAPLLPSATGCHAPFRSGTAVYDVTVSAPGYAPKTVQVDEHVDVPVDVSRAPSCCPACPPVVLLHVALDPV
jgi:hypothetical protein